MCENSTEIATFKYYLLLLFFLLLYYYILHYMTHRRVLDRKPIKLRKKVVHVLN
jgi:hypothetical protein